MKNQYKESIRNLAEALNMSDLDVTDHYNQVFGQSFPAPIYRHLTNDSAAKLLTSMSLEAERRENERSRRRAV